MDEIDWEKIFQKKTPIVGSDNLREDLAKFMGRQKGDWVRDYYRDHWLKEADRIIKFLKERGDAH